MTDTFNNLCSACNKHCTSNLKTELALRRNLTYIYLNNGNKIINSCNQFSEGLVQKNVSNLVAPLLDVPNVNHPPKLNFEGNLKLSNFISLAAK